MKIGVIQALDISNVSYYERKHFWEPCMQSVRTWAERWGYGYHFYDTPILPEAQSALNVKWKFQDKVRENQFNKFAWMRDQVDNYDMLCWIDADIYVWGYPLNIFHERFGPLDKFNALFFKRVLKDQLSWKRVCLAMFWASSSLIVETADWMDTMIHNPDRRGAYYTTFLMCCQKLNIDFTEEIAFSAWYHENKDRCYLHDISSGSNEWYVVPKDHGYVSHKDSFNHLTGSNKFRDKQRFDAYRAYLAYDEGRQEWIK
jgi:hypothetical protein